MQPEGNFLHRLTFFWPRTFIFISVVFFFGGGVAGLEAQPAGNVERFILQPWQWDGVVAALEDPNMEVQRAALNWLSKLDPRSTDAPDDTRSKRLAELVDEHLSDSHDFSEKIAALRSLYWGQSPRSHQLVVGLFKSKDPVFLKYVLAALEEFGPDWAMFAPQVADLLNNKDTEVQAAAIRALGNMGPVGAKFSARLASFLKSGDFHVQTSTIYALVRLGLAGTMSAPQLAELLKKGDSSVRGAAAYALGAMGPDAASLALTPELIELLRNRNPEVFNSVGAVFQGLGPAGVAYAPKLTEHFNDKDPSVRCAAADLVGIIGAAAAAFTPEVAKLLKDDSPAVQRSAANALIKMGPAGKAHASQVAELLKSNNTDVQSFAAGALGKMGSQGALFASQIAGLLNNKSNELRCSALSALGEMGLAAGDCAPQIAEQLKYNNISIQRLAAIALGRIGPKGAVFAPQIAELLKSDSANMRGYAVYALGNMGLASAPFVPQIAEFLDDTDFDLRISGAVAIGKIGPAGSPVAHKMVTCLTGGEENSKIVSTNALIRVCVQPNPSVAMYLMDLSHGYIVSRGFLEFVAYLLGGGEKPNRFRVQWLSSRSPQASKTISDLNHTETREVLAELHSAIRVSDKLPTVSNKIAKLAADLVRKHGPVDNNLVLDLMDSLEKAGYPDQARTLEDALKNKSRLINKLGWSAEAWSAPGASWEKFAAWNLGLLATLYSCVIVVLFIGSPLSLVQLHEGWAIIFGSVPWIGDALERVAKLSALFLITSRRCLDAVVHHYAAKALVDLEKRTEVGSRHHWIAAPLEIRDEEFGTANRPFVPPKDAPAGMIYIRGLTELGKYLTGPRRWVSIEGPGGVGKSVLAFQIARWFADSKAANRLHQAQAIPIFVRELKEGLDKEVLAELKRALGMPKMSTILSEALLKNGRVLAIVDGVSEKKVDFDELNSEQFNPAKDAQLTHFVVVTSRRRVRPNDTILVRPLHVDLGSIDVVLNRYIDGVVGAGRFSPAHREAIRDAIKRIMDELKTESDPDANIPLVFIKLIVDRADRVLSSPGAINAQDGEDVVLPQSLSDLVDQYLASLLENTPDKEIHAVRTRKAALACVGKEGLPVSRPLAAYRTKGLEQDQLDLLVTVGLLTKDESDMGDPLYKFALDPIAEYLAAKELVTLVRDGELESVELARMRAQFNKESDVNQQIIRVARAKKIDVD
ncbi:MAG: HEAT repeat domain-containing protein [Nibricoccus sp.]